MKNAPLISVVIPAYNAGQYIERCIQSVLKQTYPSLEIIAVNDGSTDNTGALLDKLAAEDARVKPIHQQNTGAAKARLTGIRHAKGDYLTFVDIDDFVDNRMLEYLLTLLQSGEYQICCCRIQNVSDKKPPVAEQSLPSGTRSYDLEGIMQYLYEEKLWSLCGKLFNKELFDGELLTESLKVSEDLLLAYSAYRHCRRLVVGNAELYYYYRHSGSVMAEGLNEKHIHDSMRAYRLIADDMDSDSAAYIYHIQNLLSNDFGFLNRIILKNTCRNCYGEIRKEILKYGKYAFLRRDNPALNSRHRLGVVLLRFCPPLFNIMVKIKG